jgi:hypothetical protein
MKIFVNKTKYMNKQSIVSKAKFAALALFFATAFSTGSFATDSPNKSTTTAKTFDVKYMYSVEDGFVFNVKYDNLSAGYFDLLIKDETGETLYQRSFSDKTFSKKFQLSKSLIKAVFIIRPQQAAEQSFEVMVQSRVTEDVVVSRL